jgi:heme-degrading monooxygenase HmoA
MFVVCNRIPVNPDYAEAFEARFADRSQMVDGMPGFVAFNLLRPTNAGDPYVVLTFWEKEENFKAWTQSAEFKEGHARSSTLPPEAFQGHPKLELFDVIQTTAKIESINE